MTIDTAAEALFRNAFVYALIGRDRRRKDNRTFVCGE